MTAFGIAAANPGYPFPVIATSEKVLVHHLDPFETKLSEGIGILLIIPAEGRSVLLSGARNAESKAHEGLGQAAAGFL